MSLVARRYAFALVASLLCLAAPCQAHGFGGSGLLHPLTGPDHMLAMLAVGSWSAQRGGPAIYRVPALFMVAMGFGALLAGCGVALPATEFVIALSVLLLGAAIAVQRAPMMPIAMLVVMLFGTAHGYSHGLELPGNAAPVRYVIGFLVTTAGLHVAGAVGALLTLEQARGIERLRWAGAAVALAGAGLLLRLLAMAP